MQCSTTRKKKKILKIPKGQSEGASRKTEKKQSQAMIQRPLHRKKEPINYTKNWCELTFALEG